MANTYASPPALPNPDTLVVGNDVRAIDIDPVRDAFNFAIGTGADAMGQAWPQGECERTGAAATVCMWRLAHPTNSHTSLTIRFRASGNVVGGKVIFSGSIAGSVSTAIAAGAAVEYSITLGVGSGDESDLMMELEHLTGDVTVWDVSAWWDAIPSPLPAGGVDVGASWGGPGRATIYPLGANGTADRPIPASRGRRTLGSLRSLLRRPRQIAAWSGIANTTGTPVGSASMQAYPHRAVYVLTPGGGFTDSTRRSDRVRVYVFAVGTGVETKVYVQTGGSFTSRRHVITVPAPVVGAWYELPLTLRALPQYGQMPWPTITVGIWPTSGAESGRTTADIRSWSAVSAL